jgi:DNA-binding CsgD family transcriptional regulator
VYSYNEFERGKNHAIYKIWPESFPSIKNAQEILAQFGHQIPMHARWNRGDGQALKISDFLSPSTYKKKEIYNEFYRPMRIPFTIGVSLPISRQRLITIGSHRDGKDFTERERTTLNLIQPHLLQAYANAQTITRMEQARERLQRCLELTNQALVSLTPRYLIEWATPPARSLLTRYWPTSGRLMNRLPSDIRDWVRARDTEMGRSLGVPAPHTPLTVERNQCSLRIRYLCQGDTKLLFCEEHRSEWTTENLPALGLSKREVEILGWVAQGKSNPEIGVILGISHRTVQKHLERIYIRLGVENRHAAMAIAMEARRSG